MKAKQNELSKKIPSVKDKAEKDVLVVESRGIREQVGKLDDELKQIELDLKAVLVTIPNMTHPDAPVGATPADNKVVRRWGEPRKFDFVPKLPIDWQYFAVISR